MSADVVAADGMDDGAGAEEQQRLEDAVRQQVEEPGAREPGADRRHHVAELRDRRIRQHALDVGLHAREHGGHQRRDRADPCHDREHVAASSANSHSSRVSRYTPAVTIVAA